MPTLKYRDENGEFKSLNQLVPKEEINLEDYYTKLEVDNLLKDANEIMFAVVYGSTSKFVICYAQKGMTWEEFINSEYNTLGFYLSNGYVDLTVGYENWHLTSQINTNNSLPGTEIIISGQKYTGNATCCFEAGTQVLISLEGETRNIEDVKYGDQVVSYNPETEEFYVTKVARLVTNNMVTNVAEVYFDNDSMLRMNEYHPILTTDGYHSITNHEGLPTLNVGDTVVTENGTSKIMRISRYTQDPEEMYNLSINDENHNYLANGIVVHNAGCAV